MMSLFVDRVPCKLSMNTAEPLALNTSGTWTPEILRNPLIMNNLIFLEAGGGIMGIPEPALPEHPSISTNAIEDLSSRRVS
jgi:hypothetical protein